MTNHMKLIKPLLAHDRLLADIAEAKKDINQFHLWWLGQSGFLLQWHGRHILIDPYLSDSLTKKYRDTDKPHIRMTELAINPDRLDFIDVVTSSHNHTDHLDGETLIPLIQANPKIKMIVPEANRHFAAKRLQVDPDFFLGLNDLDSVEVRGFQFTGIPAAHELIERDAAGFCKFLGYIIQFGSYCVYHSGDTIWHEDIVNSLQSFKIDVAILPINGRNPARKVAGNLNAQEAVKLGKLLDIKCIIPCHYDMFTFNTADPKDFQMEAQHISQPVKILQCGERWSSGGSLNTNNRSS